MSKSVVEPIGRRLLPQSRMDSIPTFRRSSRDFDSLKSEQARLETFYLTPSWPVGFVTPQDCAKAGFFYLQDGDKVQCAFCRGIAGEWEEGDNPMTEHRRHFPKCPFVCNLPVGNIPLASEYDEETASSTGSDVCGPYLDFATSLSIQFSSHISPTENYRRRVVSDQDIRDLIDTPIVQGALEMGIELSKVKNALIRKIQETGTPFCTTGALLDAVLRTRDPEYESDPDSEIEDEDYNHIPRRPQHYPFNFNSLNLNDSSSQLGGDEDCAGSGISSGDRNSGIEGNSSPTTSSPRTPASRSNSGDSGLSAMSGGQSSEEMEQGGTVEEAPRNCETSSVSMKEVKNGIECKEEELRQLREVTQCKICMDNRVQVVFLPCGHLVSCTRCATALSNCAVCREPIKAYVKTYLS